ncbi:hypothetical protein F4558_000293 [Micromonospora profundi]|uniref:hypothetical protein n=1 Tax=Micromonospora profundi TaxID=1420889 RepID=UPI00143A601F|nr:hypothetical protein [Micromonospora profundi]NJC10467.1 hypothetical protein [Micromonospora profundi]
MIRDANREDRVAMTFGQRNAWVSAVVMPAASIAYLAVVLPRLGDRPAAEVSWVGPMLWTIGATVVGTIVGTILISIAAAITNRDVESKGDVRDKQIDRYGDRLAQAITAFGGAVVLALVMFEVDHFWIGNALFVIGAIGATWGAVAKIRAYHGVFNG